MKSRISPVEFNEEEFLRTGHKLIEQVALFYKNIHDLPVTTGESPEKIHALLNNARLDSKGREMSALIPAVTKLLTEHSLLNGHPKFMGYITGSPSPIGALADLLAAAVNPNVGANILSPVATAIEQQTIKWLSEFIGYTNGSGGILVSGGNMANFTGFLAARTSKAKYNLKLNGISNSTGQMIMYCSKATHTWIDKAAILFGHGTNAVRWIAVDNNNRMDLTQLKLQIEEDQKKGLQPFFVVGTAGDVSTGAVDDLNGIAEICKSNDLWFHVDGAYGVPAAVVPEQKSLFNGLEHADSIAMDPHKWLYCPLEAGCALVKDPKHLHDTFSSNPEYYNFSGDENDHIQNFYEYGIQNSRGFRALKVWLTLQQAGRNGYIKMIGDDIKLSKLFYKLSDNHPELEAVSQSLSITNIRYVPLGVSLNDNKLLNKLNESLLNKMQRDGKAFLSNAVINDKYCLRSCIVNFRTTEKDIEELIDIIIETGREVHNTL